MASEEDPVPPAAPLGRLIASAPSRRASATGLATLGSVTLHAALVAGAVWLSIQPPARPSEATEQLTLLHLIEDPIPAPAPLPAPPVRDLAPDAPGAPAFAAPPEGLRQAREEPAAAPAREGTPALVEPGNVPDVVPPGAGIAGDTIGASRGGVAVGGGGAGAAGKVVDPAAGPVDVPHTHAPELVNGADVRAAQLAHWPRALRRAGVGGRVELWLLVDEEGAPVRALVRSSSGQRSLDQAALEVARVMRFRPARDGDRPVSVWVIQTLEFHVR